MAEHNRKRPPVPLIVLVLLLLIGGGIWWWSATSSPATPAQTYSGSVDADTYQVAAASAGRVVEVKVAEGDKVTKDQVLVRLDDSALKLQLSQAKQGVTAAKAALTNARNDGDSTKADITAAKARLKQAEAAVKLAQVQLGYATIIAPRSGLVVSLATNAGQNAGPGKTLLTILDPADLFVRIHVPETEIGKVSVGQVAKVTTDSSISAFDASVTFIASEAEFTPNVIQTKEERVKLVYQIRLRIADPSGTLKPGMPVDVSLA